MKFNKIEKTADDFGGFHPDLVPPDASSMIGMSGAVDASRLKSYFSRVDEAINLVNSYNSSLLKDIVYIFDFSNEGAYGVYIDKLSQVLKLNKQKVDLENMGYEVEIDDNLGITAIDPTGERDSDQIQKDMNSTSQQLEQLGGVAIGVNMAKIKNSVEQDVSTNVANAQQQGATFDEAKKDWLVLINLASTIVHEATHALGHHDEAAPEAAEDAFLDAKMPEINDRYKMSFSGEEEEFVPLEVTRKTRSASGSNWYRTAQSYVPNSFFEAPRGSDLSGRFPISPIDPAAGGRAPWGLEYQQGQTSPIENRLGRQFMSRLPPDVIQETQTINEQLQRMNKHLPHFYSDDGMEQRLQRDHIEDLGYTTMEGLLDERRPAPIMLSIDKEDKEKEIVKDASSGKMKKEATLFGWFNNLDISDGSTLSGLGDRVMEWEEEEESFNAYESWIRGQSRYNPTYNTDGTYYVLDNVRGWPYSAKSITDAPNYHFPRSASINDVDKDGDVDLQDFYFILKVLNRAKKKIARGEILSTRFIVSNDILSIFKQMFDNSSFNVYAFEDKYNFLKENEDIYCVWVTAPNVKESDIREVEEFMSAKEVSSKPDNLIEKLLNLNAGKEAIIEEVIKVTKKVCREYGIKDVYLVGGYPRDIMMGNPVASVRDLDFSSAWPSQSTKVGGLVAERLGVHNAQIYKRTMTLSFTYKGLKIDFKGNFSPVEIRSHMRQRNIPTTPLNNDIYNRDFVMNMLVYDVVKGKTYDITGEAEKDIKEGVIRTFFDPDEIVKMNPLIMARALKFKIRYGFDITPELKASIINNADLLFDGRYSDERLKIAKNEIEKENYQEAQRLFEIYGLSRLKDY
jgi:hypothetical protein